MRNLGCVIVAMSCLLGAAVSQATVSVSYQYVGKGNWSLDAVGSNNTPVGNLRALVPPGSTVVKAFLYCSRTPGAATITPTIVLSGTTYGTNAWTALGLNVSAGDLQAFRADVTAQVADAIGSGNNNTNLFSVDSEDLNDETDGEALTIVYSNPAEQERTIAFLDGFSSATGDSVTFYFAAPLVVGPNFECLLSLGIGYSYQEDESPDEEQYSQVDINGRRLTTAAGGSDDGQPYNGGLITIGGIGDSTANPVDPYALPTTARSDDELYDLSVGNGSNETPFVVAGNTSFTISTLNPSDNDNIFFMGVNVTAVGSVNTNENPGTCSSTADLMSSVDSLGITRSQTLRLERQVTIIGKAVERYPYAAAAECRFLNKLLGSLVKLGIISSDAQSAVAGCCSSVTTGVSTNNNNNNE